MIWFQVAAAKDPDAAFFKKLDGFQPCEVTELKAGTSVFAVYGKLFDSSVVTICCIFAYALGLTNGPNPDFSDVLPHVLAGDNFFKSVSYTIEALCAAPFTEEKENLRAVEAQILSKRVEISKFETEYREVWISKHKLYMSPL